MILTPTFYHGHVTHPDLWMMWYCVWFCAVLTLYHSLKIVAWVREHFFIGLSPEWKLAVYRVFYDGWHHCVHIGCVQAEIYTWDSWWGN